MSLLSLETLPLQSDVDAAKAARIIEVAEGNLHRASMLSSAALNLNTAKQYLEMGAADRAVRVALRSLAYSCGMCCPVFLTCARMCLV